MATKPTSVVLIFSMKRWTTKLPWGGNLWVVVKVKSCVKKQAGSYWLYTLVLCSQSGASLLVGTTLDNDYISKVFAPGNLSHDMENPPNSFQIGLDAAKWYCALHSPLGSDVECISWFWVIHSISLQLIYNHRKRTIFIKGTLHFNINLGSKVSLDPP